MSESVAVVGSRGFQDLDMVREYVRGLPLGVEVVSGGARGVDTVAEETALACGLHMKSFPAEWGKHGGAAGYIRNHDIVKRADRVVAFWDGESKGTKSTIEIAMKAQKPLDIFVRPRTDQSEEPDDE